MRLLGVDTGAVEVEGSMTGKGEREREEMRHSRVVGFFFLLFFYAKTITTQPGRSASAAVNR